MNSPESLATLPPTWRFQILPFPFCYDWHLGTFLGFYKDRWSLESKGNGFVVRNYDTSYFCEISREFIMGWKDDATKRADGMPFGTLRLRCELHLWHGLIELMPISESKAWRLPKSQNRSPELMFDFSPQCEREYLWWGYGMKTKWASMFPGRASHRCA